MRIAKNDITALELRAHLRELREGHALRDIAPTELRAHLNELRETVHSVTLHRQHLTHVARK